MNDAGTSEQPYDEPIRVSSDESRWFQPAYPPFNLFSITVRSPESAS